MCSTASPPINEIVSFCPPPPFGASPPLPKRGRNYVVPNLKKRILVFLSPSTIYYPQSEGMVSPEMVEVELGITCKGAKVVRYKFLRLFLSDPLPSKIGIL